MKTKKISLNEFRNFVKQIIKEEVDMNTKFKEIYSEFERNQELKKYLNMSTFEIPGNLFETDFLDIIAKKTGFNKVDIRNQIINDPTIGGKNASTNSQYERLGSPTVYTNGWYLNAYEVLRKILEKLYK
jgi:hypothetical protein